MGREAEGTIQLKIWRRLWSAHGQESCSQPERYSVAWNKKTMTTFDVALIATNHACVNYQQLASWTECIVDTRNAMAGIGTLPVQVWKA